MPYKVSGKNVLHKKNNKWSIKQRCKSHTNAIKALGLLQGLERGTIKSSNSRKSGHK
jgi:hypothetical protein